MFVAARSLVGRAIYVSAVVLSVGAGLVPDRGHALAPVLGGFVLRGLASGGQVVTRTLPLSTAPRVPAAGSQWVALPVIGTLGLMGVSGEFLRARPALAPVTTPTESGQPQRIDRGYCQLRVSAGNNMPYIDVDTVEAGLRYIRDVRHRDIQNDVGATWAGSLYHGPCAAPPPLEFSRTDRAQCSAGVRRYAVGTRPTWAPGQCLPVGDILPVWREEAPELRCPPGYVLQGGICVRYVPDGIPTVVPDHGQLMPERLDSDPRPAGMDPQRVRVEGVDPHGTPVRVEIVPRHDGGFTVTIGVQSGSNSTQVTTLEVQPDGQSTATTETRPGTPTQQQPAPQSGTPPPPQQELKVETCGLPGKPPCKIDETGTPTASSDPPPQLQAALDQLQQAIGEDHEMPGTPPVLPSLPSGRCSPIQYSLLGRSMSLDLCPYAEISRLVLGWLYAMLLGWYVWRRGHDVVIGR